MIIDTKKIGSFECNDKKNLDECSEITESELLISSLIKTKFFTADAAISMAKPDQDFKTANIAMRAGSKTLFNEALLDVMSVKVTYSDIRDTLISEELNRKKI